MKMNKWYTIKEVIDALEKASESPKEVANYMRENNIHETTYTVFNNAPILPYAPFPLLAVMFTNKVDNNTFEAIVKGFVTDEPKKLKFKKETLKMVANDDYTQFTIIF